MKKIIYISVFTTILALGFAANCNAFILPPIGGGEGDSYCFGSYYENIYCSNAQISAGICSSDAIGYDIDSESGAYIINGQYYTKLADITGNNPLTEEQLTALRAQNSAGGSEPAEQTPAEPTAPKAKRTYYTIEEAMGHLSHDNNNKIIFTFK